MTTPEHPDEPVPTDAHPPLDPPQLPADTPQSLLDRLAQLEPEDDDDLFDDEGYDEDDEDLAPDAATDEPAVTSYDDSAFAAVGEPPAPAEPNAHAAEPDADEHDTTVLLPDSHDTTVLHPDSHDTTVLHPDSHDTTVLDPAAHESAALDPAVPALADEPPGPVPAAAGADEAADTAEEPARNARRRGRRRPRVSLPVVALLLMTVLMAAATAFLWLKVNEKDRTEDARRAGLEASRDAARLLFSYDYRTLDKDFSTGRALTTGEFRSQYEKTTTKVVADVAKQYKAVVKANVVSAGVVRATPSTVVTVVYVNQVTTSTRVTGEKVDLSRVRMTLQRSGGRWLVTAVNAL